MKIISKIGLIKGGGLFNPKEKMAECLKTCIFDIGCLIFCDHCLVKKFIKEFSGVWTWKFGSKILVDKSKFI